MSQYMSGLPAQSQGTQSAINFSANNAHIVTAGGHVGSYNTNQVLYNIYGKGTSDVEQIDAILGDQIVTDALLECQDKGQCYPGTREELLARVERWGALRSKDKDEKRSGLRGFWRRRARHAPADKQCLAVVGVPGSGKSTVAATIASRARSSPRTLHAHFFIRRGVDKTTLPGNILPTIATQLAHASKPAATAIRKGLQGRPWIAKSLSDHQVHALLLDPLSEASRHFSTVVIIVDALDELAGPQSFINAVAKVIPRFPPNVRICFTYRPESIILTSIAAVVTKIELELRTTDSETDVKLYLQRRLKDDIRTSVGTNAGVWSDWPSQRQIDLLASQASGLFVWASTAIRFIVSHVRRFGTAGRDDVINDVTTEGMGDLNALYGHILSSIASSREDDSRKMNWLHHFKCTIGYIVVAKHPLSIEMINGLLNAAGDAFDLAHCLEQARSLFIAGTGSIIDSTIPQIHKSFFDYITGPNVEERFRVDVGRYQKEFLHVLFHTCNTSLRFNICQLETSYVSNNGIEDLHSRLDQVPVLVKYSCQFWPHYMLDLPGCGSDDPILSTIQDFMEGRFLWWLEVLSLLKLVTSTGLSGTRILAGWCQTSDPHLTALAKDANKFISAFSELISKTAPHIYLSALPLSPSSSHIYQNYHHYYLNTCKATGIKEQWKTQAEALYFHTDEVYSIAFSPDGTCVVFGSMDGTIWIWNHTLGNIIAGPFEGHGGSVQSVAFSPDGTQIASGSQDKTVRVWDVTTGATVAGPFEGHGGSVLSVAFSPDGTQIASGSDDKTVRVWDATTGATVAGPFEGHGDYVLSVAFSPDGTQIASGSDDMTVRVWDATTGATVAGPFEGHGDYVRSVAFSPDGTQIASGSDDMTVRVWDARTGATFAGPFEGHGGSVQSVAFSPDGTQIASGSDDMTVRVWDATTGATVAGPFEGHGDYVRSVAFSPDGTQIASGSQDKTVRVWDARTGATLAGPFEGHGGSVLSVAFSPDGTQIASGSGEKTVRVWDARTGATVAGPFEGHGGSVQSVAFSPDGTQIASGSGDKTVRVWNAWTGATFAGPFEGHGGYVQSVAFSPDGTQIASGSDDMTVRVWDARTGATFAGPFEGHGSYVRVWDARTGATIAGPFEGHGGYVRSVAFSPDGTQIASGSDDKTVRVWDARTGATIAGPFEGHIDEINSVAYSPDGTQIASGSGDKTVRVLAIASASHQAKVCR